MRSLVRSIVVAFACLAPLSASAAPLRKATITRRIAREAGKVLGYSAGFVLTGALAFSKTWNRPLVDDAGAPVTVRVGGVTRMLRARHAAVAGPEIAAKARQMPGGTAAQRVRRTFVWGVVAGATAAPRAEGRLEARLGLLPRQ